MKKAVLRHIDTALLEHKDDIALRKKLDAVPMFKQIMTDTVCALREKYVAIEYAGNGLHINDECLPELHSKLKEVCHTLGATNVPGFSLMWGYDIAAATEGVNNPHITAISGAIDLLADDELAFMLGHEMGHQMCGHKPYHVFLESLYMPVVSAIPGGEMWIGLVRSTLLNWYRMSDFTADRMGLLACQDFNAAMRALIKMAGIPRKYFGSIDIDSFIKQAREFDAMFAGISGKLINYISVNSAYSPWIIARAANLHQWYKSGEYDKIINDNLNG
ncbi:MAG TPA: M48 family metallopeptidase [Candidatus Avimuribaculum pullicola]|nr:M48 family metallopeptidase [Candidatus Avimuribaculum pullicola]